MFKAAAAAVEAPVVFRDESPVPLSHLQLDLGEPVEGWRPFLADRHIEIVTDDLGRLSVARDDARRLFDEHHNNEVRKAELRAAAEKRAIEADQRFRASLGVGVPASAIPAGMTYAEAVVQAGLDSLTYRPGRRSLVEDALDGSGITFHPIQHEADES